MRHYITWVLKFAKNPKLILLNRPFMKAGFGRVVSFLGSTYNCPAFSLKRSIDKYNKYPHPDKIPKGNMDLNRYSIPFTGVQSSGAVK